METFAYIFAAVLSFGGLLLIGGAVAHNYSVKEERERLKDE